MFDRLASIQMTQTRYFSNAIIARTFNLDVNFESCCSTSLKVGPYPTDGLTILCTYNEHRRVVRRVLYHSYRDRIRYLAETVPEMHSALRAHEGSSSDDVSHLLPVTVPDHTNRHNSLGARAPNYLIALCLNSTRISPPCTVVFGLNQTVVVPVRVKSCTGRVI